MPRENTSERLSMALPQACSGLMYRSLPRSAPLSVVEALLAALAMPKSVSFTSPSNEGRVVSGGRARGGGGWGWSPGPWRGRGVFGGALRQEAKDEGGPLSTPRQTAPPKLPHLFRRR